jgi:hypothetical protein
LTFRKQRVTITTSVKRVLKTLTAFSLLLFFTFAVCGVSMAAPALSIASPMPGCSQDSSPLGKTGCEQPSFLCGFSSSFDLLSRGVLVSSRTHDFSKVTHFPTKELVFIGSSDEIPLAASRLGSASASSAAQKVSIHLFNSILTL